MPETLDRAALWAVQTPQVFRRAALARALAQPDEVLAAATDDAGLVEQAGGRVHVVESPAENLKVTTRTRPAARRAAARRERDPPPMLTDYHVHLRPDGAGTPRAELLHARERRALPRGGRASAGSPSWASPSTSTASARRSTSGSTRSGARTRVDDLDAYCEFVREQTDCASASRPTSSPAREDRMANLLDGARLGLRDRLGPLRRRRGGRPRPTGTSGRRARSIPRRSGRRYFELLGEAARSGLFDILAHPDLVKVWGGERPQPDGDLRRFYELAIDGIAESRDRDRGVHGGAAQAGRRALPGAAPFLEMCLEAGCPIALDSDAHDPETRRLRVRLDGRVARRAGRARAVRVRGPRAAAGADRVRAAAPVSAHRHRLGRPPTRARPAADPRRRARRERAGARGPLRRRRAHARGDRRAARRDRRWATSASTSPTPTSAGAAPTRWSCCATSTRCSPSAASTSCNVDATVDARAAEARLDRKPAMRAALAGALGLDPGRVNVKATRGEGIGFVGRVEGAAALGGRDRRGCPASRALR